MRTRSMPSLATLVALALTAGVLALQPPAAAAGSPAPGQLLITDGEDDQAVTSALAGLDQTLAELRARDVSVVLQEGFLTVSEGDRVCTVDVATMLAEVESGLQGMFVGMDGELPVRRGVHHDDGQDHEAARLRDELDSLKAEVDRLRDDLQRLR